MSPTAYERIAPWITAALLVALWWAVIVLFNVQHYVMPTPIETIVALFQYWRPLATNGLFTLGTTVAGFLIAVVFGMALGILVGSSRLVYCALYPIIVAFNSVPKAALVPILVVWFGLGTVPAILTAFMLSFFPVVANVALAFSTIEPELDDLMRSLGGSRRDMVMKIGIPRSLPYVFASLKIAITLSFVGSVIAEIIGGNSGIGNVMLVASSNFNMPLVFAALVVVGVMGIGMYAVFDFFERRMTSWSVRAPNPAGSVRGA
ncbi:ABC transporter permease [Hansschlegelia sp.]|uniref:ABC transporter permease n=1 Tax=Hansschlegelia sp. TaxID=2041892 RepID=UPI002B8A7041|nr:ABC transporter permease [Hansschlegelia sp.]HVI27088.1 ABC transporter permease [Hansschlegelia sp.]